MTHSRPCCDSPTDCPSSSCPADWPAAWRQPLLGSASVQPGNLSPSVAPAGSLPASPGPSPRHSGPSLASHFRPPAQVGPGSLE